jgi:thioredoxin-related protein
MSRLALFLIVALAVPTTLTGQSNGREPLFDPTADPVADLEAAIQEATDTGRRIILDVGGNWCGWCYLLHDYFEEKDELREFRDEHFVWVLVNYDRENRNEAFLGQYPAIRAYPHLFVLDSDGTFLHSQGTGVLEEGRGYSDGAMWAFLREWAPDG